MRSTLLIAAVLSCACGGSLSASATADSGIPISGNADGGSSASSSADGSGASLDSGGPESESPDAASADDGSADDGGLPFVVVDQVAFNAEGTSSDVNRVQILSYGGACALLQQGSPKATSVFLDFIGPTGTSFAVGKIAVGPKLTIALVRRDAACNTTETLSIAGSLTIATLDSTSLTGTFIAEVGGFGTVTGNIDAPICNGTTPPGSTCVP